jgi:hypothetical protein
MIMAWSTYSCPNCKRKLSDSDIAEIHFKKRCLYCNSTVHINGREALTNTLTASFLAVAAIGIYVVIWISILESIRDFYKNVSTQMSETATYIIVILFLIASFGLCLFFAALVTKLYRNFMLKNVS